MAVYRYLTDMVQSRNDPSIIEPRISYELPDINVNSIVEAGPEIPAGRVLVTCGDMDENDHRAVQAIDNTSWFKP